MSSIRAVRGNAKLVSYIWCRWAKHESPQTGQEGRLRDGVNGLYCCRFGLCLRPVRACTRVALEARRRERYIIVCAAGAISRATTPDQAMRTVTKQSSFSYEELLKCGHGELFGPGNARLPLPPL